MPDTVEYLGPPPVFPVDIKIGNVIVYVQADGSVRGDRAAFAAALRDARAYRSDISTFMTFVSAAMLLNAPWQDNIA